MGRRLFLERFWPVAGIEYALNAIEIIAFTKCCLRVMIQLMTCILLPNDNRRMFLQRNWHLSGVLSAQHAIQMIVTMALLAATTACTPAFNWREVSFDDASAAALLPCKPDRGTRPVQLAGQTVQMSMAGCEAGGAMFTVALVQVPQAAQASAVAAEWKASNKATHSRQIAHGTTILQGSIYGHPNQGRDDPSALSAQAVETFLSNLTMAGAQ
jgi:hypothetical protein